MMKTPLQFLMDTCRCGDNCNINYRPYEYGSLVESIPIKEAEERLAKDIQDMKDFASGFSLPTIWMSLQLKQHIGYGKGIWLCIDKRLTN